MESILRLFPVGRYGPVARYVFTTAIVGFFFAIRFGLPITGVPALAFIPAVLLAALLFGLGAGIYATLLSVVLAIFFFIAPLYSFHVSPKELPATTIFIMVGVGISWLCHELRTAFERQKAASQTNALLLEELSHRTLNNLQMIVSLLNLQARGLTDKTAQMAVQTAATRVQVIARVQNRLRDVGVQGALNMRSYLDDLCRDLAETARGLRPIAIRVEAEPVELDASLAISIGLVVNELLTNAFKYAFPEDAQGAVVVRFRRNEAKLLELIVEDNGIGCETSPKGGGSRLIQLLAQGLNGTVMRDDAGPGCRVTLTVSADGFELKAA